MNINDLLASIEKMYPHLCGLLVHPKGMYKDVPISRHMLFSIGKSLEISDEKSLLSFIWDILKGVEKYGTFVGKYADLEGESLLFYICSNQNEIDSLKNKLQENISSLRAEGWTPIV